MKKVILALAAVLVFTHVSHSQNAPVQLGTNVASLGLGIGGHYGSYTTSSRSPGISLQLDHGFWEAGPGVVTLGAYIGTKTLKYNYNFKSYAANGILYTYAAHQKWNYTIIGARGAYHYNGLKNAQNFDLYGGLMLSYNILSYKYSDDYPGADTFYAGSYGSYADLSLFAGGRYFFSPMWGAFLELGYGVSYVTVGASAKF